MGRLVPEDIDVTGDVDVNINLNLDAEKIGNAVERIIWTLCAASVIRSRCRK